MKRSLLSLSLSILFTVASVMVGHTSMAAEKRVIYLADKTDNTTWNVSLAVKRWNRQDYLSIVLVPECNSTLVPCRTIVDKYEDEYYVQWYPNFPQDTAGYYDRYREVIELYTWMFVEMPYWTHATVKSRQRFRDYLSCHEIGHYIFEDSELSGKHSVTGCLMEQYEGVPWPGKALLRKVR